MSENVIPYFIQIWPNEKLCTGAPLQANQSRLCFLGERLRDTDVKTERLRQSETAAIITQITIDLSIEASFIERADKVDRSLWIGHC